VFQRSIAKLSIGSLDDPSLSVDAHYNPKELSFQRSVPWATHQLAGHGDDQLEVEFTGAQPRMMDLELMFDCYEQDGDDPCTIEEIVEVIETLATVRDPSGDAAHRRPHFCIVTWGDKGVKPLRCVIESVAVKYTMLDRLGKPLRAVCNIKVREARIRDTDGHVDANDREQLSAMRKRMAAREAQP
jgi:hypothetical protein